MANTLASRLDVAGQLSVLAGDVPIDVEFRGDVIVVTLPDLRAATRVLQQIPTRDRRAWGRRMVEVLARSGLEVQIWTQGRQIAELKPGQTPGLLARWLGVGPLGLRFRAILASMFGRPPAPRPGPTSTGPDA